MEAKYIDHMGSDLTVVNAARVSFAKQSEMFKAGGELYPQDKQLIGYLARHNHWTPFAHPQITLHIKAPIFIRTQCFKHKVGFTENEISRRYVDSEPEIFSPEFWRSKPTGGAKQGSDDPLEDEQQYFPEKLLKHVSAVSKNAYKRMVDELGVCPEQARMVLPQAMYTEWYWTGSLAAYARFCKQRLDPHAQKEIQELAAQVSEIIAPLFPVAWEALSASD